MRELPQLELEPKHYFADGVYVRELHVPKGATLVGKIHRTEHICMLIKGRMVVADEQGSKTIEAPLIYVAPAGSKKAGYAVEDCIFINVHPVQTKDLEEIERQVIAPSFEALEADSKPRIEEKPCLG